MTPKDGLSVHGIFSYNIDDVWQQVAPFLNEAISYSDGKFTLRKLHDLLVAKHMQLWVAVTKKNIIKACAVTEIVDYPAKRVLFIVFAAGIEMHEWIKNIEVLQNFAAYHDCEAVEIYGRPGWEKVLKDYGYIKTHSVYRLQLGRPDYEKDLHEISFLLQQENEKV